MSDAHLYARDEGTPNIDEGVNDIELLRKCEKIVDNLEKDVCTLHKKTNKEHSYDELIEDYNIALIRVQRAKGHLVHTDDIDPEGITTFAELTSKGLSNVDLQAAVASNTRKDFETASEIAGYLGGYFVTLIDEIASHDVNTKLGLCALLISGRNQRLTSCASNMIYDGFYEVGMPILRVALENYLLLLYLKDHPAIIDDFWNGNIQINSSELVNHGKTKTEGLGEFWGELCNTYTHANIVSIHTITVSTDESETTAFHVLPYYDKNQAKSTLLTSMFIKWLTFKLLIDIFPETVQKMSGFLNDFNQWSKVLAEYTKNENIKLNVSSNKKS